MRTPIANPGNMFEIDMGEKKKRFMLNRYSGEGGSCLAYSVTSVEGVDQGVTYVLKEFYPEGDYVFAKRDENGKLKFADRTKEEPAFIRMQDRFKKGYERLVEFANKEDSVNFMSKPAGFWFDKETGNMYSLVHWDCGKTLDEYDDLEMTVKALKKVALVLGKWHELGFYHLDVKPENILYMEDTESIHLYDCDTVMTKEEIQDQTYPLRKSENDAYVSKELIDACTMDTRFYRQKINQKADIYSIGAMLYKKVTGIIDRRAISEACGEGFPLDLIKQDVLQDMEPRLSRMLSEFFVRTMHTRQAKRFETMKQVYAALERIENVMNQQSFLVGQTIGEIAPDSKTFVDREELTEMDNGFRQGKTIVLSAMGGMGKSTLARRYAQLRKEDYDIVLTHDYKVTGEEGLKRSIADICNRYLRRRNKKLRQDEKTPIVIEKQKEMQMSTEEQMLTLRQLCHDSKVLLIIDNFDVEEDGFAKEFRSIGWHVIYTSRCELRGFGDRIDLKPMGEQLEQLFVRYYHLESKDKIFTDDEKEDIRRLLDIVGRNTLATELLAKELSICEGVISIAEMAERIKNGIENNRRKINYIRDNEAHNKSLYLALHTVFDVSEAERSGLLDEEEVEILRHLTLLAMPVTENEYIELAELDKAEFAGSLVMLKKKGWLQEQMRWKGIIQEKTYCLHPVVADVLRHEFVFNMDNCGVVVENMLSDIERMKATFVFRNVKGKLAFVEMAIKLSENVDSSVGVKFECTDEILVRLYDACGVLNGEESNKKKATEAFGREQEILHKIEKMTAQKMAILKMDDIFWGESIVQPGEVEEIADRYKYYVAGLYLMDKKTSRYVYDKVHVYEDGTPTLDYKLVSSFFESYKLMSWYEVWLEKENAKGIKEIGDMFSQGGIVGENADEAFRCYQKAAELGYSSAQYNLGVLYYKMEQYEKACEWWRKSAMQGNAFAQYWLGYCYSYDGGLGVKEDYDKGTSWYIESFLNGNISALAHIMIRFTLGVGSDECKKKVFTHLCEMEKKTKEVLFYIAVAYSDGIGVEKNKKKAFCYYLKSAENGNLSSMRNVIRYYEQGIGVDKNWEKAFGWKIRLAEASKGKLLSYSEIADSYYFGKGVAVDCDKAIKWYQLAKEKEFEIEKRCLAREWLKYHIKNNIFDYEYAIKECELKSKEGDPWAQCRLGELYLNNKANDVEAIRLLIESANSDNYRAQYILGELYYTGFGGGKDYEKAFFFFEKLASQEYNDAMFYLGDMYYRGEYVEKNIPMAIEWWNKAGENTEELKYFEQWIENSVSVSIIDEIIQERFFEKRNYSFMFEQKRKNIGWSIWKHIFDI